MIVRIEFSTDVYLSVAKEIKAKLIPCAMKSNIAFYYIDSNEDAFISEAFALQCIQNCSNVENVDYIEGAPGKKIEYLTALVLSGGNSSFDMSATKQKLQRYIYMFERNGPQYEYDPTEIDNFDF